MEKRDTIVIAVAIIIVLVMALYVKPLVTGKEVKIIPDELAGLFGGNTTGAADNNTSVNGSGYNNSSISGNFTGNFTGNVSLSGNFTNISANVTSTPAPTPVPTWNGSTPENVGYAKNSTGTWIASRPYPQDPLPEYDPKQPNASYQSYSHMSSPVPRKLYTTFKGTYSATTNPISLPDGSWEIVYTVDVADDLQNPKATEGEKVNKSHDNDLPIEDSSGKTVNTSIRLGTGSVSAVNPSFTIKVRDTETGQILRTISPPGGINPKLWVPGTGTSSFGTKDSDSTVTSPAGAGEYKDPRPWKEDFYEGNRSIALDIEAKNLKSYKVDIYAQVPGLPTPNATPTQETMKDLMTGIVNQYIGYYNGNLSDPDIYYSLTDLLSSQVMAQYQNQGVYSALKDMKESGIWISGFSPQGAYVSGTAGTLKGDVIWSMRNTTSRTTLMDIPFVSDGGTIKMDDLIRLRY